ncbi:MAG TPA: hypothetical protein VGE04_01735, partial [Chloroflexia bacterium]
MARHSPPPPRYPDLRTNLEFHSTARHSIGRPSGVAILVALHLLAAVVALVSAILLMVLPPVSPLGIGNFPDSTIKVLLLLLGIPVNLSAAMGLWMLKNWARFLALLLYGLIIVQVILTSTDGTYGPTSLLVLASGAAFYYLCRPEVRAA